MAKKKRYHQSRKDRMHEREGMERYERRSREDNLDLPAEMRDQWMYHGGYSVGGRVNQKSPMIKEEYNEPSNLPRDVKMKQYPQLDYIRAKVYDSMEGVDMDIDGSVETANKHLNKRRRY